MKKFVITAIILIGCCMIFGGPIVAQAQYPPSQPPMYYQPYVAPQPYAPPPSWGGGIIVEPTNPCGSSAGVYWSNPQCMYQYGLQLVYAKRYYEAIQVFDQFLRFYPQSSLADNALYWTGECYYAMKQYTIALTFFQRIPVQYPRGNKVPDSLLKTALSYFSMKQNSRGCQVLNDLMYRYPNSESARKGYRWLGRCGWAPQRTDPCSPYPTYPQSSYGTPYPSYPTYPQSNTDSGGTYYYDQTFPKNY